MAGLDALMARHDKTHVFCRNRQIDGIELNRLPGYMSRALPLFGKLDRFGR